MSNAESQALTAPAGRIEAFTFGDPTPVLESRGFLDYVECVENGRWYEPPVSLDGLARTTRSNVYLQSGLIFKRNMLARTFIPHRLLSGAAFEQLALDWVTFGMAYVEDVKSVLGSSAKLQPCLTKYMRRGVDLESYFMVRGWRDEHAFRPGAVYQLREADVDQEIYGMPEWLAALQSALLNESATLFRRKYYNNGSHAGFILYLTDAGVNEEDVDNLRTALRSARGPGNFRNLFLHSPNGKKDGMQLIPVSEVAAKDEFSGIKNITRDDMLGVMRVPPQLLGIVPQNAGGFGNIREATVVWAANELEPLQTRMCRLNDLIGDEVIRFRPYEPPVA
ncbi:phage portal protein [Lysobacter capsici]|uniref:phage portal protein n=1 Tax=Lysobacter capsici TaxID=435897 RepID=UPI0017807F26|nr:phage portal protein [Lysobacter capsici]UOF16473.1 phage portal protein [Lysobacter capsici]